MNAIMLAGTSSNVGKTTISLGIMAALTKRGLNVGPYKVGPDYIDPGFHKFVTGNSSHNLDSWLLDEENLRYLFNKNLKNKDIGIVEGVMGLYDGYGTNKDDGSSAHVSKIIKTPVILIIDGKGISSSAAAIVLGYKMYDQDVDIKGIIINQVSGKMHYDLLKEAIERDVNIPCVGYLPKNTEVSLNSRHLGLIPVDEVKELNNKIDKLVNTVEECIDIDEIIKISNTSKDIVGNTISPYNEFIGMAENLTIGIARDKAFTFYYEDNIQLLKEMGANIVYFSPLEDKDIPDNIDGLYIGGGFPEVFAKELEDNYIFRKNLKNHLDKGLPAYAECGGMMYLTNEIIDLNDNHNEMVGYFPTCSFMTKRLQRFGYVNVDTKNNERTRAHEFHHSMIEDNEELKYKYDVKKIRNGQIKRSWKCGLIKKNVLAGYPHIHFYSNPEFLIELIRVCKENKKIHK